MKRILAAVLVLVMAFVMIPVVGTGTENKNYNTDALSPTVIFSLEAEPVFEGDTILTVNLIATLPEDATGYELGAFEFYMTYDPEIIILADYLTWEVDGGMWKSVESDPFTTIPYLIGYSSVNPLFNGGVNLVATMYFDIKSPATTGTDYKIDLVANRVASISSINGEYTLTNYADDQYSVSGIEVRTYVDVGETPEDYFTYIIDNDEASIISVNKSISGDVFIPDTLGGYPVTTIGPNAFSGCSSIEVLEIPDSVKHIGVRAFINCSNTRKITIGDGLISIGEYAFEYCYDIEEFIVSPYNNTYKSVDGVLFTKDGAALILYPTQKNDAIFEIPEDVENIGDWAFAHNYFISSIIIPDSLTTIGDSAFNGCLSLENVIFGDNVTSIGKCAFGTCISLENITIPNSITTIDDSTFFFCTGLTDITIPDSVTKISDLAFSNCTNLSTITIPDNVTYICDDSFEECENVTIACNINSYAHEYAINNNIAYELLHTSDNKFEIDENGVLVGYYGNDEDVHLPEGITKIGDEAFAGNTSITSVVVSNSVTSIGEGTFSNCTNLQAVIIPDGVTSIGYAAFIGCTSLEVIYLPDSLLAIDGSAFCSCTSLREIVIPNNISKIESYTFNNCTSLESVILPQSLITIGGYAFWDCIGLENIEIPVGVSLIDGQAFDGCLNLETILIPDSVTEFGYKPFGNCDKLTIYCSKDSIAHEYSVEQNIPYVLVGTDTTPGDANNDGKVNLSDVTNLLQYIAKWDVTIDASVTDVTGDDIINLSDVTRLLQYIAKWDVVLGNSGSKPTDPPTTEPVSDVLIISNTQTLSNQTINTDVYITSTGNAIFEDVTINGNIYCYGQLDCSGCTANNVYAYAYGSMMNCAAFDGTHGKVSGGISCDELIILDNALDYAFSKWGKS